MNADPAGKSSAKKSKATPAKKSKYRFLFAAVSSLSGVEVQPKFVNNSYWFPSYFSVSKKKVTWSFRNFGGSTNFNL